MSTPSPDTFRLKPDFSWLPDLPDVWGPERDGVVTRWAPGAFGDRETIEGVDRLLVEYEHMEFVDGVLRRTVLKGFVVA